MRGRPKVARGWTFAGRIAWKISVPTVLGLVKRKMVKNDGYCSLWAKGGFVGEQLKKNASREEVQAEVSCYTTFISGLLDITDKLVQNEVVPPAIRS